MSTTLQPPAAAGTPPIAAAPPIRATHQRRAKRGIRGWILLVVLIALVAGAWWSVSALRAVGTVDDPTIYAVQRRSFPVIVEAKGELKAKKTTDIERQRKPSQEQLLLAQ